MPHPLRGQWENEYLLIDIEYEGALELVPSERMVQDFARKDFPDFHAIRAYLKEALKGMEPVDSRGLSVRWRLVAPVSMALPLELRGTVRRSIDFYEWQADPRINWSDIEEKLKFNPLEYDAWKFARASTPRPYISRDTQPEDATEKKRLTDFFFPKSTLPKSRPGGGGFMGHDKKGFSDGTE